MTQAAVLDETKEISRQLYNGVTTELGRTEHGDKTLFLNYGYLADKNTRRACADKSSEIGEVSANLVLEVIGSVDLTGKDVLDVGCGRGGTIALIAQHFSGTRSLKGVDLSPEAIAFCRQAHAKTSAEFVVGDAENLPIDDASVDVLINIESACVYPDVYAFYKQAHRVLRNEGHFLYADCIDAKDLDARKVFLAELGFRASDFTDITTNVLLSCDLTAKERYEEVRNGRDLDVKLAESIANLICVPGSRKYSKFASGLKRYVVFEFIKER